MFARSYISVARPALLCGWLALTGCNRSVSVPPNPAVDKQTTSAHDEAMQAIKEGKPVPTAPPPAP